ncbi:MAG: TIGR03617 family F420-dependent LLM class oxidoreductase [Myxococcota bacterium]|jgi:probable F420-dependent oxidoreductase|nr:TIGR03617 family F420-dependent LLM class oxidoreductase [Myxococcota bacterium]
MKVDAAIGAHLSQIGTEAPRLEALGYDGLRLAELNHDPFMALALAAASTDRIELVTSVAVAFSRNPMSMAILAHDLNAFSGGRFVLGLGSQVKPHIERRFSMPWHKAARQMREFIEAMQAIFDCWYDGKRLQYTGEYYQHTLMPDTFRPEDTQGPRPRITLSATGPLMTKVAARVADGMIMHPFSTEKYMREVTVPAIEAGLHESNRSLADFELDYAPMTAAGASDEEIERGIAFIRGRIAFYGCTVAYRPVLEIHGWGDLQDELIALNRKHETDEMAKLITDEMVDTFAIVGRPREVIEQMRARFGGLIDRTGFSAPGLPRDEFRELLRGLQES